MRQLLTRGAPANGRGINNSTPVHAAASGGRLEVLKFLVTNGGELDASDNQGRRPLYEAAANGSLECCRYLVQQGASLDASTVGDWTALDAALHWGTDEVSLFLLESGADQKFEGSRGEALIAATRNRFPLTVGWLLQNGADPRERDSQGSTALHHAASFGGAEVVELLLKSGGDPAAVDGRSGFEVACQILERILPYARKEARGLTAAVGAGNGKAVELLLENGFVANEGAALLAAQMAYPDILQALLLHGAPRPTLEDVEALWVERKRELEATIQRHSGARNLRPELSVAYRALEKLAENGPIIVRLLERGE